MAIEVIDCPYCGSSEYSAWAEERGFTTVRCRCGLLYVNPRPTPDSIHAAVSTGIHAEEAEGLNAIARRDGPKVARYRSIFSRMFADVWARREPISWLDVGAGYGEVVEAVVGLAPAGSRVEGLEPMHPKAAEARRRGLTVEEDYLRSTHAKVGFISSINVFSHIPDYGGFLSDVRDVLLPRGELFIETGNLADLDDRNSFPGPLGVPDHLVFAGMNHIRGFLDRSGFDIVKVEQVRSDDVLNFAKNIVKRILRPRVSYSIGLPYTSPYRQLMVRARLRQ
jgi:SAM-dependent methyltransferase